MRGTKLAFVTSAIALGSAAYAVPTLGDVANGARLYRLHCAGCHGPAGRGDGYVSKQLRPEPANLRGPGLLLARGDDALYATTTQGGKASGHSHLMPGFGRALGILDAWDIVALLRDGQLALDAAFPDAQRFHAKRFTIDGDGVARCAAVVGGRFDEADRRVDLAAVFGTGRPPEARPISVPDEPLPLDSLKPKEKVGYLAVFEVPATQVAQPPPRATPPAKKKGKAAPAAVAPPPAARGPFDWTWAYVPVGIAMDRDGVIKTVLVGGQGADRDQAQQAFTAYAGQGGKRGDSRPEYKPLKAGKSGGPADTWMTRLYYRALEAALMFDKEEHERTWADPTAR